MYEKLSTLGVETNVEIIIPLKRLKLKSKMYKPGRLPREEGKSPVNVLLFKYKILRLDSVPRELGIVPFKLFTERSR